MGKVSSNTLGRVVRHLIGDNPHDQVVSNIAVAETEQVYFDLQIDAPVVYEDYYCRRGDVRVYDLSRATSLCLVMKAREQAVTLRCARSADSDEWQVEGETPYGRENKIWYNLTDDLLRHVRFRKEDGEYPLPSETQSQLDVMHHRLAAWHLRSDRPTVTMPNDWTLPESLRAIVMKPEEYYPMEAAKNLGIKVPV